MATRNTYFQDEVVNKKLDISQFKHLASYLAKWKKTVLLVLTLMIISAVSAMLAPLLIKKIINEVVYTKDVRDFIFCISAMIILAIVEIGTTLLHQTLMGRLGHRIIAAIRCDIFYKLQELPFEYFDNRPNGKIVVRVTDYVNDLANFFTSNLLQLLTYIMKIVLVTFFMIGISPHLTMVVYMIVIPMMTIVFTIRYFVKIQFGPHRAKISNRIAFLMEAITGERIIKNYNRKSASEEIYHKIHMDSVYQWVKVFRLNRLNSPTVEIFWTVGSGLLYGTALYMILNGDSSTMNAGIVVAFTTYMSQFSAPLSQIAMILQNLAQVSSNLERIFDTIEYPVNIKNNEISVELSNPEGYVDFNDVTFAYEEGVNILEHFTLHVEKGQTIALVGPTGAGKTTIINMLTRFYDVTDGSVQIDGIDVRDISLASLRKEVGVLMQDPFIFKGTIIDNIRYGRLDATDEECIAAAKAIHADHFIERLPNKYMQELEERGGGLSAGEKQLLSFARIILKNPSIVILDEATSAIDTETELLIKQALDTILAGKTAFMVAHRLSTIRNADKILYIYGKGIAEQGTHEELMAQKGLYYSMN